MMVDNDNVFDSLPDDDFFDQFDDSNTKKETVDSNSDFEVDDIELEDEPLEIPNAEAEEELDFLDDLFDD